MNPTTITLGLALLGSTLIALGVIVGYDLWSTYALVRGERDKALQQVRTLQVMLWASRGDTGSDYECETCDMGDHEVEHGRCICCSLVVDELEYHAHQAMALANGGNA